MIVTGTCITLVALFLQFKANKLSKEANELARESNSIAQKSFNLQFWDECHSHQVCQSDKSISY